MSRLRDLSKDKVTIMMRILSSQNLCKAIYYTDANFESKPDIEDPSTLIYQNIFPFRKVPPKEDNEVKTYITMSFGGYRPISGGYFKVGKITINVLVNVDNMRTDYGILRTDYIISEIDELINSQMGIGMFKAKFSGLDDLYVNEFYMGTQIQYELTELN